METNFHFVDGLHADRKAIALSRSHVMKGKNAGRKLHRRSRLALQNDRRKPVWYSVEPALSKTQRSTCEDGLLTNRSQTTLLTTSSTYEGCLLSFSPKWAVTPASMDIINEFFASTSDRLYPVRLGISLHETKRMYLQVLFADEASYHCNIALMQACNAIYSSNGNSPPKALYYLSQTFAWVRSRLESDDALSDSSIAIVLSLISQELIRNRQRAAAIHFKGLEKMVELRGGLSQLEESKLLALKICKTDIILALWHGRSPKFFRDGFAGVQATLMSRGFRGDHASFLISAHRHRLEPDLYQILVDVTNLCSVFSENGEHHLLDVYTIQEVMMSVLYRLLRCRTTSCSSHSLKIHTGLTIFMLTALMQHGPRQLVHFEPIDHKLMQILEGGVNDSDDETMLWLTFIGGIWASAGICGNKDALLTSKLRTTALRLRINTFVGARAVICRLPWIGALHDEPGRILWERATSGRD